MSKYTYDNYTITVNFETDFIFAITASDVLTGDVFINEAVELTKIKKDTVLAALARKNQKNLTCKLNLVDVEPKKLIIAFQVSFDFLPTFTEYVSLDQIQKKGTGLNKVESAELRSDIQQLQKMLENISTNENSNLIHQISGNAGVTDELHSQQLDKGSYLFEISGVYTNTSGGNETRPLNIVLQTQTEKYKLQTIVYINGAYGYPFTLQKALVIDNPSKVKISISTKQGPNIQIQNTIITFSPMIKVK